MKLRTLARQTVLACLLLFLCSRVECKSEEVYKNSEGLRSRFQTWRQWLTGNRYDAQMPNKEVHEKGDETRSRFRVWRQWLTNNRSLSAYDAQITSNQLMDSSGTSANCVSTSIFLAALVAVAGTALVVGIVIGFLFSRRKMAGEKLEMELQKDTSFSSAPTLKQGEDDDCSLKPLVKKASGEECSKIFSSPSATVVQFLSGGRGTHDIPLDGLDWNTDVFKFSQLSDVVGRPIYHMGLYLMDWLGLISSVPESVLRQDLSKSPLDELRLRTQRFLYEADERYLESVAYHNAVHACDVMKNMVCVFQTSLYKHLMAHHEWSRFICTMAAAMHDMGHTGQSNNYHIAVQSELALRYNDNSPLEQMHVATAFIMMSQNPDANWFSLFRPSVVDDKGEVKLRSKLRKLIIGIVLATDAAVHKRVVENIHSLIEKSKEGTLRDDVVEDFYREPKDQSQSQAKLLEAAMCAADIGNPTYILPLSALWSERILNEFWAQGDLEKEMLGAVSAPMFEREKADVPGSQIGFIKFMVDELWQPVATLLPEMKCNHDQMKQNLVYWEGRKAKGVLTFPAREELEHNA